MDTPKRFVYLTTTVGTVQAHLVVGRLQSEGIDAVMSGPADGPYPFPNEIAVLVTEDQLEVAREVLLVDQVEATFDELSESPPSRMKRLKARRLRWFNRRAKS